MIRGFDHAVHVVEDLSIAAAAYERLGFRVGAENTHPWGTKNRLVQFPHFYVELLSIPQPEIITPHRPGAFSFGAFNRDFFQQCGEGFSQLALSSVDPDLDKAAFDKAGFGGDRFDFARKGKRANGEEVEVAFSLAFAHEPTSPHVGFFSILHKTPENLWSPEMQRHANGVKAVGGAVFVAENPTDHHIFFEAFSGARDVKATSLGIRIETPRGEILVYDRRAFVDAFGAEPPKENGLRLMALVFKVADTDAIGAYLEKAGLGPRQLHQRLVVGPKSAAGSLIAFEP